MTDFLTTAILNQTEDYQAGYRDGWEAREKVFTDPPSTEISAATITGTVCGYFQADMIRVTTRSRKRELVYIRQICAYFLRKYTTLSLKIIAEMLGRNNHATTTHSVQTVKDLLFSSPETRKDVTVLDQLIKSHEGKTI